MAEISVPDRMDPAGSICNQYTPCEQGYICDMADKLCYKCENFCNPKKGNTLNKNCERFCPQVITTTSDKVPGTLCPAINSKDAYFDCATLKTLLFGVSIYAVVLSVVLLIVLCICCRRVFQRRKAKTQRNSMEGRLSLISQEHGSIHSYSNGNDPRHIEGYAKNSSSICLQDEHFKNLLISRKQGSNPDSLQHGGPEQESFLAKLKIDEKQDRTTVQPSALPPHMRNENNMIQERNHNSDTQSSINLTIHDSMPREVGNGRQQMSPYGGGAIYDNIDSKESNQVHKRQEASGKMNASVPTSSSVDRKPSDRIDGVQHDESDSRPKSRESSSQTSPKQVTPSAPHLSGSYPPAQLPSEANSSGLHPSGPNTSGSPPSSHNPTGSHSSRPLMSSQHPSGTHPSSPYMTGPHQSGPDSTVPNPSYKDTEKKLEASKRTPPTPRSGGLSGIEDVIDLRSPTTQDESTVSDDTSLKQPGGRTHHAASSPLKHNHSDTPYSKPNPTASTDPNETPFMQTPVVHPQSAIDSMSMNGDSMHPSLSINSTDAQKIQHHRNSFGFSPVQPTDQVAVQPAINNGYPHNPPVHHRELQIDGSNNTLTPVNHGQQWYPVPDNRPAETGRFGSVPGQQQERAETPLSGVVAEDLELMRQMEEHPDWETFEAMKEFSWVQGFTSEGASIEVFVDSTRIDQPHALAELVAATSESPAKFKVKMCD